MNIKSIKFQEGIDRCVYDLCGDEKLKRWACTIDSIENDNIITIGVITVKNEDMKKARVIRNAILEELNKNSNIFHCINCSSLNTQVLKVAKAGEALSLDYPCETYSEYLKTENNNLNEEKESYTLIAKKPFVVKKCHNCGQRWNEELIE